MEPSFLPFWHNSVGINQNKLTFKSQINFPSLKGTTIEGSFCLQVPSFLGEVPIGI